MLAKSSQAFTPAGIKQRRVHIQCQSNAKQQAPMAPVRESAFSLIANRRQLVVGTVAGAACACCPPLPANAADWGYSDPGPEAWGAACNAPGSIEQSPIDIPISKMDPVRFSYPESVKATVVNNGHGSPQVNFGEDAGCFVEIEGETYRLIQFHFHSPSEHTFNGKHTLMEVHLVHKNVRTGELAVCGVLIQAGADKPNPALEIALESAPSQSGVDVPISQGIPIRSFLPKPRAEGDRAGEGRRPYATYPGSLTTPPCTEGVTWVVFLDPIAVQASQVLSFLTFGSKDGAVKVTARPTQPLGPRQLRFFM